MIIPEIDTLETKLAAARRYIAMGWPVFVLGYKKTPVGNCHRCDAQRKDYIPHDRETCECLMCHGFYAATLEIDKVRAMLEQRLDGMLALRTGGISRLLAIDAESGADERAGDNLTGLDVLDDWENWTGFTLNTVTLRQRTGSGGLHLIYRMPDDLRLGNHNRILPQVDIKADGGYIAVPDGVSNRMWLDLLPSVAKVQPELIQWIQTRKTRTRNGGVDAWRSGGSGQLLSEEDFKRCLEHGAGAGEREPFFAMLSFKLFKKGLSRSEVEEVMREHWLRCEQTSGDEFAWASIEYKLNRDEHNVIPLEKLDHRLQHWVENLRRQPEQQTSEDEVYKVGRVTLVRRKTR